MEREYIIQFVSKKNKNLTRDYLIDLDDETLLEIFFEIGGDI